MKISEFADTAWKEFAIYTVENRAIPSFVDGFKPVQRFLFYQGIHHAKGFDKVAAIGSSVAAVGYHHGEASAQAALSMMAASWCNNIATFEGDGQFGSRISNTPAAARYIYARISPVVERLFNDWNFCPEHPDKDHVPPKYYLPLIPMCLVNGTKGIATGYSCDIPPHDPISIIDSLRSLCQGKNKVNVLPKYFGFTGDVMRDGNTYISTGTFERVGANKILVTEIPFQYEGIAYEEILDKLQEKGVITDYANNSANDKFSILVTLKRGTRWTDEDVINNLKLRVRHTWNVTTISPDGKLTEWNPDTAFEDIVREFYKFRVAIVGNRIQSEIVRLERVIPFKRSIIRFCEDVVSGNFNFKVTADEFRALLESKYSIVDEYADKTMKMPILSFTKKYMDDAAKELADLENFLEYFKNTTPNKEYLKDLDSLKKFLLKGK